MSPHQHFIPSCLSCISRTSVSWMVLSYSLRALPMVGHHGIRGILILFMSLRNTLPETNSLHLKMDGWKMKCLFWGWPIFRCELLVSGCFHMFPTKKGQFKRKWSSSKHVFFFRKAILPLWKSSEFLSEKTGNLLSKKSPTGPTERTPNPEYLIALAIDLGVRW